MSLVCKPPSHERIDSEASGVVHGAVGTHSKLWLVAPPACGHGCLDPVLQRAQAFFRPAAPKRSNGVVSRRPGSSRQSSNASLGVVG